MSAPSVLRQPLPLAVRWRSAALRDFVVDGGRAAPLAARRPSGSWDGA